MHLNPSNSPVAVAATPVRANWALRLVVAAALLAAVLLIPRVLILEQSDFKKWPSFSHPVKDVPKALISGTYDFAFAAALGAVFLIPVAALQARGRRRRPAALYAVFVVIATLVFLAGMMNTEVIRTLGRPFNYQWLYYSDFLKSVDSHQAMLASLTPKMVVAITSACAAFVLIAMGLGILADRFARRFSFRTRAISAACVGAATLAFIPAGHWYLTTREWPYDKLANPIYAFAHSWATAGNTPSLFTMATSVGEEDFAPPAKPTLSKLPAERRPIRHVVLWVFESVPWEYVGAYGSEYGVTPNLDRWAKHGAVFENIYAHAPATNKTLFSLFCSAYPWISFKAETEEFPHLQFPSITSELKSRGFIAGAFYGGDSQFQGAGKFLSARGFDYLQDYRQRKTSRKLFTHSEWPFLNGTDELSTAESLITWFDEQRGAGRQTLSMLWTNQTHYPYFTDGQNQPFGPEKHLFNQYLNALHAGDQAFGALMSHLEAKKLLEETLIVVVGDHGEAFMRHNQLSHGNKIYEENCRVPLILINPALFAGQRYDTVGGIVDVAPTISDVLGLPPAAQWQGRSLFSSDRPNRTYFFAPWSDHLFGLREGNRKFIYNASQDYYELYDLSADPTEQTNLINAHQNDIQGYVEHLAAWVQYQERMFEQLLATD